MKASPNWSTFNRLIERSITIEELLEGKKINMPPIRKILKQAKKEVEKEADQKDLF